VAALKPVEAIHETLSPVYETVRILTRELPRETTLIGFAGAPWTVATYMIAGRGTPDQGPAHAMKAAEPPAFEALMDRMTEATIEYLSAQIDAGAEVVKMFDSWAGSLKGEDFTRYALEPARRIIAGAEGAPPGMPVIAFPREAGTLCRLCPRDRRRLRGAGQFGRAPTGRRAHVQVDGCVQGNLARITWSPGGPALVSETKADRAGVLERAAYLQPGPRDHALMPTPRTCTGCWRRSGARREPGPGRTGGVRRAPAARQAAPSVQPSLRWAGPGGAAPRTPRGTLREVRRVATVRAVGGQPSRRRAMTCAWISAAPSKIERMRASQRTRLIGYSSAKPLPPWICSALSAAAQAMRAASSLAMPASRSQRFSASFSRPEK
jgi:hypothetical protein